MPAIAILFLLVGLACIAFGVVYRLNESKMRFHLFWIVFGAVLAVLGVVMATGVWHTLPFLVRMLVGITLAAFLVYELVAHALILRHFHDAGVPGLDYIIVLGAQVFETGPGRTLVTRLDTAATYLAANPRTRCITCGGQGNNEPESEARSAAEYLKQRGVDPTRIILEEHSHSTLQNLENAKRLIQPLLSPTTPPSNQSQLAQSPTLPLQSRIGIVTNDYHLFRALMLARKAGLENTVGIAAKAPARFPINNTVRETFALLKR